jgi:hypothetical protein
MLFSETQLSAGVVTLPFYWLNDNPIFAYNVLTIVSVFLSGWFMYLLAKYLSRGNEYISILAALIFEFAPFKIAAIFHLQNLSILVLPLAVLLVLKYFASPRRKYLVMLFLAMLYVFYASWVQMVFVLMALGLFLLTLLLIKYVKLRPFLIVCAVIGLATLATLPLAKEYIRFSKENKAGFSVKEQVLYSSSVADYFLPYEDTLIGRAYYKANPGVIRNAYNLDSYSYHGLVMYAAAGAVMVLAFRFRKKSKELWSRYKLVAAFVIVGAAGLIISFGPFLKFKGGFTYPVFDGINVSIPMPWLAVDVLMPQLAFIRAIGRISVLFLFALCCLLVFLPGYLGELKVNRKYRRVILVSVGLLVFIELMPIRMIRMAQQSYSYNYSVPAVYRFIKDSEEVNDIIILNADYDYPGAPIPIARAEQVLWAGHHNKNIFNGYSGYEPREYIKEFEDFVDFRADDIPKLKERNIHYVLVDKELMTSKPWVDDNVSSLLPNRVYTDERYSMYKVE